MTYKFNVFLLKYLLSEDLVNHFLANNEITDARFDATILPQNNDKFFANISTNNLDSYAMFGHEIVRIEITNISGTTTIFYLFFRNGRIARPDLGARKYTFTRPSSIEIGFVDTNGAYNSFYKKHYTDWFTDPTLVVDTKDQRNQNLKDIEYDVINAIITEYNIKNNSTISLKTVDSNGHAIIPSASNNSQPSTNGTNQTSNTNNRVISIVNKITK